MINRIIINYLIFLGFCAVFQSFRQLSSFLAFTFGVLLVEYIGYSLTNKE